MLFNLHDQFTSEEKAAEVSEFFATRVKPSFERALKQSLERVRISARWIDQGTRASSSCFAKSNN